MAVVCLLTVVLIARLFYLQVVEHDLYTTLSHNNRVNIEPIGPTRGLIYDRNGVLLAENRPTFSLEIVPERVEPASLTKMMTAYVVSLELRNGRLQMDTPVRIVITSYSIHYTKLYDTSPRSTACPSPR